VDRLDQLYARSRREIETHAVEVAATETGRYYIDEAVHLLAGLRMWAQVQYRADQVVREILESGDVTVLRGVARDLRAMKTRGPRSPAGPSRRSRSGLQSSWQPLPPTPFGHCDVDLGVAVDRV
jgi:hypothetical protein